MPDTPDGDDIRIGTQRPLPERDVAEWKALGQDKGVLVMALYDNAEEIPEPVKSALSSQGGATRTSSFSDRFMFCRRLRNEARKMARGGLYLLEMRLMHSSDGVARVLGWRLRMLMVWD